MAVISSSSSFCLISFSNATPPSSTAPLSLTIFSSPKPKPPPYLVLRPKKPQHTIRSVSFFPGFSTKSKDAKTLKEELYQAIASLDRGAEASPEDQEYVDQLARQLESVNEIKEPLKSNLLNGKWELLYTTSQSILKTKATANLVPLAFLQATANLVPLNSKRVAVKFDYFRIANLIPIKSPGSGRGQLEITYLDDELRISRGDRGNLFILKIVDPSYRVPL
ncbi:probable plastid-lipid-associated protein 4, chloroplastic isoform X3 [Mangifera indica]|uniref:probable plastid-lipid-associated protein 4, chloroplastic isoform X3 n=1 Tax=Mangifera indica TaxID=29780 RepID=UPI001CFA8CF1|nr:probable plastid-lipid-associated protein 4, chloroplastic isoform X3 [Mangifera indica]